MPVGRICLWEGVVVMLCPGCQPTAWLLSILALLPDVVVVPDLQQLRGKENVIAEALF